MDVCWSSNVKEKWIVYICVLVFECEREMDCLCMCVSLRM